MLSDCMVGDLSQRLFTLLIGRNVHLFYMKIYYCIFTAPWEALWTEPEDICLLRFVKYSRRKIGGIKFVTSRNGSVAVVSRPQTGQPRNRGLVPGRSNTFFLFTASKPSLGITQPPFQRVTGVLFPGQSGRRVKLPFTSIHCWGWACWKLYVHSSIHLHGVVLN
jgi:hypothetical protein